MKRGEIKYPQTDQKLSGSGIRNLSGTQEIGRYHMVVNL